MRVRGYMRWIGANMRVGSVVALLALFFQFAVALTHVHLPAGTVDAVVATVADSASDQADGHGDDHPLSGVGCDICILLQAARVVAVSTPPLLPPLFAAPASPPVFAVVLSAAPPRTLLPQSRAPPAA
jgi:hypothetical protein